MRLVMCRAGGALNAAPHMSVSGLPKIAGRVLLAGRAVQADENDVQHASAVDRMKPRSIGRCRIVWGVAGGLPGVPRPDEANETVVVVDTQILEGETHTTTETNEQTHKPTDTHETQSRYGCLTTPGGSLSSDERTTLPVC